MAVFDVNAILGGYNANASNILGGYGQLNDSIQGGMADSNHAEMQDIYDQYLRAYGQNRQDLISRGLRSTTRATTDGSSLLGQKWRAERASRDSMNRMLAGYASQIGLSGLGAAGQFLNQGNQLGLDYNKLNLGYDQLASRGYGY